MVRLRRMLVAGVIVLVMIPHTAYAYLDPGSGSLLLQLLLGGIAGAAVIMKLYWQRLREILGFNKHETADPTDSEN